MVTGVANLMPILDGVEGESFTTEEYIHLYTMMYDMLTQKSPMNKASLDEYLKSTICVALVEGQARRVSAEGASPEMEKPQVDGQVAEQVLPLPRSLLHFTEVASAADTTRLSCFHDLVFAELKNTVTTIVVGMVDDEREGQLIDRSLLKNVLDIYVEIGFGDLGLYEVDFEQAFLKGTTDYYSKKAQTWILEDSCPEYMLNAEECLQDEKERLTH